MLFSFIFPVVIWFLIPDGRYEMVFLVTHLLLLPLIICLLNAFSILRLKLSFITVFCISLAGIICGNITGYTRWGLDTGMLFNPDGPTTAVLYMIVIHQTVFITGGFLAVLFSMWIRFFFKNGSENGSADENGKRVRKRKRKTGQPMNFRK